MTSAVGEDGAGTRSNRTPDQSASHAGADYLFVRSADRWTQPAYHDATFDAQGFGHPGEYCRRQKEFPSQARGHKF